jgi:septum site-determining protein MinC
MNTMARIKPKKRQRQLSASSRPHQKRARPEILGPRHPTAMSRDELLALVLNPDLYHTADVRADQGCPEVTAPAEITDPPRAEPARVSSLVVTATVRSGQTIEFPEGDVVVIGSVSSGAEIIAGGSIHIYGTLRGRAVAGTSGDQNARIFCQSLQAELLSIDGRYRVAENFGSTLRGRPVQAYLEGMRMTLAPLDSDPHQESRPAAWPATTPGVGRWAAQQVKTLVALQHGPSRSLRKQAV